MEEVQCLEPDLALTTVRRCFNTDLRSGSHYGVCSVACSALEEWLKLALG